MASSSGQIGELGGEPHQCTYAPCISTATVHSSHMYSPSVPALPRLEPRASCGRVCTGNGAAAWWSGRWGQISHDFVSVLPGEVSPVAEMWHNALTSEQQTRWPPPGAPQLVVVQTPGNSENTNMGGRGRRGGGRGGGRGSERQIRWRERWRESEGEAEEVEGE